MRKTAIILLFLLTFPGLADSFKKGAFFFNGKTFFIEKHGGKYGVNTEKEEVLSLDSLNCYSSTGEKCVAFITDAEEIVWAENKKYSFDIKPNPVLRFENPAFYPLFFAGGRFVLIGDKSPYIFDTKTGKKHFLPSLYYKRGRSLKLVSPADIVFFDGYLVYYADQSIIVYSLEDERVSFFKKVWFDFLTYSRKRKDSAFFLFDYRFPVNVFPAKKRIEAGKKQEKNGIRFEGRIGNLKDCVIQAEVSNSGFSEELKIKIRVFRKKRILFEKTVRVNIKLNAIKNLPPFAFYQVEKAVFIDLPEKSLILCVDKENGITLKTIGRDRLYSIVNGKLMLF